MPLSRRAFLVAALAAAAGCTTRHDGSAAGPDAAAPAVGGGLPQLTPVAKKRTSIAVIGDSITEGSTDALNETLAAAGFTDVHIDGKHSRRIDVGDGKGSPLAGVKVIYQLIADGVDPDVWVVALGTNDVGQYPDAESYGSLIDEITSMLPADRPLVWADVYRPGEDKQTAMFNDVLRGRMEDRGHAEIADWWTAATDPAQRVLSSDGLHPNKNGRLVFASLVTNAAVAVR